MAFDDHRALTEALLPAIAEVGRLQLAYREAGCGVDVKADRSPVTAADRDSEALLIATLARLMPGVPIAAEELVSEGCAPLRAERMLLVDPLDGTRDFIAGGRDFTINVALVERGQAVMGIVYAPAQATIYATLGAGSAMRARLDAKAGKPDASAIDWCRIEARAPPAGGLVALLSPWRPREPVEACLAPHRVSERRLVGSSLKFCLVAEGAADIYPQPGATSAWDTAAGQALVEAAGGRVLRMDGRPLVYACGRLEGYANPPFIAWGAAAAL